MQLKLVDSYDTDFDDEVNTVLDAVLTEIVEAEKTRSQSVNSCTEKSARKRALSESSKCIQSPAKRRPTTPITTVTVNVECGAPLALEEIIQTPVNTNETIEQVEAEPIARSFEDSIESQTPTIKTVAENILPPQDQTIEQVGAEPIARPFEDSIESQTPNIKTVAENILPPQEQTVEQVEAEPITRSFENTTVGAYLQLNIRGQLLRALSKKRVDEYKKLSVKDMFGHESHTNPIILRCTENPKCVLAIETNHRTCSLRDRQLSLEEQAHSIRLEIYTCSQTMFEKTWKLAPTLRYDEVFHKGSVSQAPEISKLPKPIQKLLLTISKNTSLLEKSLHTLFDEYKLQSSYFMSVLSHEQYTSFRVNSRERNAFYDSLCKEGLFASRSDSEKETICLATCLMAPQTRVQAVKAIETDKMPKTKRAHLAILSASVRNDFKTACLLQEYLEPASTLTQTILLARLETIGKSEIATKKSFSGDGQSPSTVTTISSPSASVTTDPAPTIAEALNTQFGAASGDDVCDEISHHQADNHDSLPATSSEPMHQESREGGIPSRAVVMDMLSGCVQIRGSVGDVPDNSVLFCIREAPDATVVNQKNLTIVCVAPSTATQTNLADVVSKVKGLAILKGSVVSGKGVFPVMLRGSLVSEEVSATIFSTLFGLINEMCDDGNKTTRLRRKCFTTVYSVPEYL
ncbi:hypothetical protein CAEBREN_24521 [Caenorhabditis brenneri]|uniref:Uncharacterized protein n=1 Tax=Caenorhabditis brenneri TaxID=135651 RepID=G0MSF9_CAEBE|nr:hypothetical protein CAEBREN_24521 [Caenorhabditis brenneri]